MIRCSGHPKTRRSRGMLPASFFAIAAFALCPILGASGFPHPWASHAWHAGRCDVSGDTVWDGPGGSAHRPGEQAGPDALTAEGEGARSGAGYTVSSDGADWIGSV